MLPRFFSFVFRRAYATNWRRSFLRLLLIGLTCASLQSATIAETILFESGTLGETGVTWQDVSAGTVTGSSVSPAVFSGVRFELSQPAITKQIGGHVVGSDGPDGTFFGAIVALDDATDSPNSPDLSTPDVLGSTSLNFPVTSSEVFGELELQLSPGWYALVFGSGLFNTLGNGAMPLNNPDIDGPTYISQQAFGGWFDLEDLADVREFVDFRFVVLGQTVPEPPTVALMVLSVYVWRLVSLVRTTVWGTRRQHRPARKRRSESGAVG